MTPTTSRGQLRRREAEWGGSRRRNRDPRSTHVPSLPELGVSSSPLEPELESADLVVIVTAHPEIDYRSVAADSRLVLDFRGVTRGIETGNLVRL